MDAPNRAPWRSSFDPVRVITVIALAVALALAWAGARDATTRSDIRGGARPVRPDDRKGWDRRTQAGIREDDH